VTYEEPQIVVLASRYDMACDYVVARLRRLSVPYLRLNTEDFPSLAVELDPVRRRLIVERKGRAYCVVSERLRSVFFRRPAFIVDYGDDDRSPSERFSHIQWAAFVRNLMLFDDARWINHPVATYRAEHKALQLSLAAEAGFAVPVTRITNSPHPRLMEQTHERVAIKGLDTVLVRSDGHEMFGFTTFESTGNLESAAWRSAPATVQAALIGKLDIRVTVVEDEVFAVSITSGDRPIAEDWRARKDDAQFRAFDLPQLVQERCRAFTRTLDLSFAAIDMALCDGEYYFLEVNPTGEWAWLVDAARLPIDRAIAKSLIGRAADAQ
jgi:glutathione synthase/RimK-type ligase-like ATP-grasp enzyme